MTLSTGFGHPKRVVHASNSTTQSVRAFLKSATAALHEEVDARMSAPLGEGQAGYRRFLLCSAKALLPIETALEEAGVEASLPDWPQRTRASALRLDLADLCASVPASNGRFAPVDITNEAFQWGALYVLEGSRLGARYLSRQIPQHVPARYMRHGEGLPLWPSFLERLETSRAAQEPGAAEAGARAAFLSFKEAAGYDLPPPETA